MIGVQLCTFCSEYPHLNTTIELYARAEREGVILVVIAIVDYYNVAIEELAHEQTDRRALPGVHNFINEILKRYYKIPLIQSEALHNLINSLRVGMSQSCKLEPV